MGWTVGLATAALFVGLAMVATRSPQMMCVPESVNATDIDLCRGLEVIYPEVGNVDCKVIPSCNDYRKKISTWSQPMVKYPMASENSTYMLVMVDPDVPSRASPEAQYWRHWLVVDIKGADLKTGIVNGQELTIYEPPTPPPQTGFHRYQFRVFLQDGKAIFLLPQESRTRGFWGLEQFLIRFQLTDPEASTQFMTQNYEDSPEFAPPTRGVSAPKDKLKTSGFASLVCVHLAHHL